MSTGRGFSACQVSAANGRPVGMGRRPRLLFRGHPEGHGRKTRMTNYAGLCRPGVHFGAPR